MFHSNQRIGPYTLIRELGRGAFGVVWLAERRGQVATTRVAVKLPTADEPDIEAITNEAQLWVQASGHPNVLPVLEADVYNGQVVIVSEYAPDGPLSAWLRRHGRRAPSINAAVTMASGILSGLAHLHSRGIVHRDLKPANILLQGEMPRIADFGLARILRPDLQSSMAAGTPAYMAPEAWAGKRSVQTDLWAVGVILYEMLAGRCPFSGSSLESLRRAICQGETPPLPSEVSERLARVLRRALTKAPSDRPASADEMRAELQRAERPAPARLLPPAIAGPLAVELSIPGGWYSRVADDPEEDWQLRTKTPGVLTMSAEEACGFTSFKPEPFGQTLASWLGIPFTVTDGHLLEIAATPGLAERLLWLDLKQCPAITDAGLASVARLEGLYLLDLGYCTQVTDRGLAVLRGMSKLQRLHLEGCLHISDEGLHYLCGLGALHLLNLDFCGAITDRGLTHLHGLPLEKLFLRGSRVTDAGVRRFQRAVPGCSVYR